MRIKTFTLMTLALLVSAFSFAQKPTLDRSAVAVDRHAFSQKVENQKGNLPLGQLFMGKGKSTLSQNAIRRAEIVTPPSDGEVEYFKLVGTTNRGAAVERTVKVLWDGDDVYISGLSYYIEDAFVKGTFTSDTEVTFAKGQFMGTYGGTYDMYFGAYPASGDGENDPIEDVVTTYDGEANAFNFTQTVIGDNGYPDKVGYYSSWTSLSITKIEGEVDLPIEPPTDLVVEKYSYSAKSYFDDNAAVSYMVNVGFYGNDVYIQGICQELPDAWIKGTKDGNTITFPAGQLLGKYRSTYDFWFVGFDGNSTIYDYVLTIDPETGDLLEGDYALVINIYKDKIDKSIWTFHYGIKISKIVDKAATPASPSISNMNWDISGDMLEFTINVVDTEGNGLVMDKLSYKLWYEDTDGNKAPVKFTTDLYKEIEADMEVVPYGFTENYDFYEKYVYLNMNHDNWVKIGMQSIYAGGGETHESEIAWYELSWPIQVAAPEGVTVTVNEFKGTDSNGNAVNTTVKVAVVGDDIYIQGFGSADPTAWIKGTKTAPDTYTFAKGQDLGVSNSYKCRCFLVGYTDGVVTDAILKVDTETGVYTFGNTWVDNTTYTDKLYYLYQYTPGCTIAIEGTPDTGINNIKTNTNAKNAPLYNLKGQRVNNSYKGLVIMNGKKFMNK